MTTGSVYERSVWKLDWMMVLVWSSELQRWPSNRVTDSTGCLADLWATYHSPTRQTAAPSVTGLHLPASHSITADSACENTDRGHVWGCSQVHGLTVPSGELGKQRGQRSRGHFDWLAGCKMGPCSDNEEWTHWSVNLKITVGVIIRNTGKYVCSGLWKTHTRQHICLCLCNY